MTHEGAAPAAERLAQFAAGLRYEDLPDLGSTHRQAVPDRCDGLRDLRRRVSMVTRGRRPRRGVRRDRRLRGAWARPRIDPRQAALCLGTFAHAFELDSLRKPGVGAHPGATVALPAFAMAQAGRP